MGPRGMDKVLVVATPPLQPILFISHLLWLTECQTVWHFSSLTPKAILLPGANSFISERYFKFHILKLSLGCRVGFNDDIQVFKDLNGRDG